MRDYAGPIFAHRHYAAIAAALLAQRNTINVSAVYDTPDKVDGAVNTVDNMIAHFQNMFENDNPRFDRQRFKDAAVGDPRMKGKDKR